MYKHGWVVCPNGSFVHHQRENKSRFACNFWAPPNAKFFHSRIWSFSRILYMTWWWLCRANYAALCLGGGMRPPASEHFLGEKRRAISPYFWPVQDNYHQSFRPPAWSIYIFPRSGCRKHHERENIQTSNFLENLWPQFKRMNRNEWESLNCI